MRSAASPPTPAMNPFSCRPRALWLPGAVFQPRRVLFPGKTAAPFPPGCSMSAAGWLLRRSGWPISGAGCAMRRSWTQVSKPGCSISSAGPSLRRSGRLPISRKEHPGALMEDPAASRAHPGNASEHPGRKSGHPSTEAGASARTRRHPRTLASAPTATTQPRTENRERRTQST